MIVSFDSESPEKGMVEKVCDILNAGGIIAYPTDTAYGIGCDVFNKKAMAKVFAVKRRGEGRPLSMVCSDTSWINRYAVVSSHMYMIMQRFLPGPYTFVVESKKGVFCSSTVGIRVPENSISTVIVEALGRPISSTSANISGQSPLSTPSEILDVMGGDLDCIIDGGVILADPSTVIDLTGETPVVVRKGKGAVDFFI